MRIRHCEAAKPTKAIQSVLSHLDLFQFVEESKALNERVIDKQEGA